MLLSVPTLLSFTRIRGAELTRARLFCWRACTTTSAMSELTSAPLNPTPGMSVRRPVAGSGVLRPKELKVTIWFRPAPPVLADLDAEVEVVGRVERDDGAFDQHLRAALVERADELLVEPLHVRRADDDDAVGVRVGRHPRLLGADGLAGLRRRVGGGE